MADEVVPKAMVDALHKALNPAAPTAPAAPAAPAAQAPAQAPPAETPPPPAQPDAKGDQPRGEDGKFQKKELTPEAKGLLAGLRAEREKRKALEAEIASLRNQKPVTTPPKPDRLPELLGKMPEQTQEWWKTAGQDAIDALIERRVEERLSKIEPDLATVRASRAEEAEVAQFRSDLAEFAEDMALEGTPVDVEALVETINRVETQFDMSLGSTNRKKFENAINLMTSRPGKPAGESPEEQKARLDREAADKARAAGASPGSSPASAPPPATGEALGKQVRELALKGDDRAIAKIIGSRLPKRPAWAQ